MSLLSIEHSSAAYHADFVLYGGAVLGLAGWLAIRSPEGMGLGLTALAGAGILAWSPIEYALHRFVLHGIPPFKRLHLQHHLHPTALICAPTLISASLIGLLVWWPAVSLMGEWPGNALTLGVLIGYLGYAFVHHSLHHLNLNLGWLKRRKYWHAKHHHLEHPCCFGVTSGFWDHVFRTGWRKAHRSDVIVPVVRRRG